MYILVLLAPEGRDNNGKEKLPSGLPYRTPFPSVISGGIGGTLGMSSVFCTRLGSSAGTHSPLSILNSCLHKRNFSFHSSRLHTSENEAIFNALSCILTTLLEGYFHVAASYIITGVFPGSVSYSLPRQP